MTYDFTGEALGSALTGCNRVEWAMLARGVSGTVFASRHPARQSILPCQGVIRTVQTVGTVSDLHLFCKRSRASALISALDEAIEGLDVFVLNGDIFDFRWSVYDSEEETIRAALSWLDGLLGRHPSCKFHYVLGNHDCLTTFTDLLAQFDSTQPRLTCHPHYVRLGDTLFLHGDVAMRKMDAASLEAYRAFWHDHKRKGQLMNLAWDAAFLLNLHRGIHRLAFPPRFAVERIRYYIDSIGEGPASGVKSVYFGHTHMALSGYLHEGVQFFNGGAALQGLEFRILQTRISL